MRYWSHICLYTCRCMGHHYVAFKSSLQGPFQCCIYPALADASKHKYNSPPHPNYRMLNIRLNGDGKVCRANLNMDNSRRFKPAWAPYNVGKCNGCLGRTRGINLSLGCTIAGLSPRDKTSSFKKLFPFFSTWKPGMSINAASPLSSPLKGSFCVKEDSTVQVVQPRHWFINFSMN